MNLRDLAKEIALAAAKLHPLTDTNIALIAIHPGGVELDADTSSLDAKIDELTESNEDLEKEVKELKEANDALEERATAANSLLDEVRHEEDKGQTLRHYVTLAEEGQTRAERWQRLYEDSVHERDALRKRKGVTVRLFACEREILSLLSSLESLPIERLPALRVVAKDIREKLYAT